MKFDRTLSRSLAAAAFAVFAAGSAHAQDKTETRVFPTDLTNIAAASNGGRILASSSQLNDDAAFGAANLIDGQVYNPATKVGSNGWVSNHYDPVNMDFVTFGFKDNELHRIGKFVLTPASSAPPERWAKDVEVQVSTDSAEGPFTAVAQLTLKRAPEPQEFLILPTQARFVRLMFRSNWGSDRAVALGEVEMYDSIDTSEPIGGVIARLEGAIKDLEGYNASQRELSSVSRVVAPAAPHGSNVRPVSTRVAQADKPAPAATAPGGGDGGNIAAARNGGHIVDVTSTFGNDPNYSADHLIDGTNYSLADGKGSAGWASEGFVPGRQWVTIGFKDDRTRLVSKIVINPTSDLSTLRWVSRVDVQVTTGSPKDGPWNSIAVINVRPDAANQDFEVKPSEAKYVRFVFTANGPGNVSPLGDPSISSDRSVALGEIEIYEPIAAANDLTPLISRFRQILIDLKTLRGRNPSLGTTALAPLDDDSGTVHTVAEARVAGSPSPRPVAGGIAAPKTIVPTEAAPKTVTRKTTAPKPMTAKAVVPKVVAKPAGASKTTASHKKVKTSRAKN